MKYKMLTIQRDADNKFIHANVLTDIGNIEINDEKKLDIVLGYFAKQEGLEVEELLKKEHLVKKIVEKEEVKEEEKKEKKAKKTDDVVIFDPHKARKKETKEKTKRHGSVVKGLIITTTAVAVLGASAYVLDKECNTFNKKVYGLFHPDKKITEEYDGLLIDGDDNYEISNRDYYVDNNYTVVDSNNPNNESEYDATMENVIDRQETTQEVIRGLDEKVLEMSQDEIFQALNDMTRTANSSLFEVSQFINERGLTGKAYLYNFENNFTKDTLDYKVVKVFSDLRNDVLKSAYDGSDLSDSEKIANTKDKIMDFYALYAKVVSLDMTIDVDGVSLDFSELTDIGKATILELGTAMLEIDLKNYRYDIDGMIMDKESILDDSVYMLEENLIPTLVDKGYRR